MNIRTKVLLLKWDLFILKHVWLWLADKMLDICRVVNDKEGATEFIDIWKRLNKIAEDKSYMIRTLNHIDHVAKEQGFKITFM